MTIAIIGTGYVGLVTGAGFAELGNEVICVDIDEEKIRKLRRGVAPIYEPGLEELIHRNLATKRLRFTTYHADAIRNAQVIFDAVDTPPARDGSVSMVSLLRATDDIARALAQLPRNRRFYRVIVNKSTVPIGTADKVDARIRRHYRGQFDVVSNPEFLREGQGVQDFFQPDRIVIGDASVRAREVMSKLYQPIKAPILFVDTRTAEMIKYASNSFLAASISFINSLAELCEQLEVDVNDVAEGMRLDRRIGKQAFLAAGAGYGGSCFPKDVKALASIARQRQVRLPLVEATEKINQGQRKRLIDKVKKLLPDLKGRTIAVWGLAFKPGTDDLRDAPAIEIIRSLLRKGAKVVAFDPAAEGKAMQVLPSITFSPNPFHCVTGADLLLVMTEWGEFRALNRKRIRDLMKQPNIVDGRNIFDRQEVEALGFRYEAIGR